MNQEILAKLKERGVQSRIAEHFGISHQAVNLWIAKGEIPVKRVVGVQQVTGIPCADLRPDIFGEAA